MFNLHRRLFRRLLAAWLGVSLLLCGGALVYDLVTIDAEIQRQAGSRLDEFTLADLAAQPRLESRTLDYARRHYIHVELFDPAGKRLDSATNPDYEALEQALAQRRQQFPLVDALHYEKIVLGNVSVVHVRGPVRDSDGWLVGYVDGSFFVDPTAVAQLRREVVAALVVALVAVLVTTLAVYPLLLALNRDVQRQARDLLRGNVELMDVMGRAVARRDTDTNEHNYRVTLYAADLGEASGLVDGAMRDLIAGAFLHDVGKIGIPDAILLKAGPLSAEEQATMRTHVSQGEAILQGSRWLSRAIDVVRYHHEKYDGSGYLRGLKGEAIPLAARIFAIADVFDALASRRPYKDAQPLDTVLAQLAEQSGRHFDPDLLARFLARIPAQHAIVAAATQDELEQLMWHKVEQYFVALPRRGRWRAALRRRLSRP